MFLLYFGVVILDLNYKIYVPLLAFFWFFTHIVEAFVIQHYMKLADIHIKLIDAYDDEDWGVIEDMIKEIEIELSTGNNMKERINHYGDDDWANPDEQEDF